MRVRANNQKRDAQGNVINTRRGLPHRSRRTHRPGLLPGAWEVWLPGPRLPPTPRVSRYTVEHAADAQFTNFRTINTAAGDPATDAEAPTELTVPQSAHAFRPVTPHSLVYGLNRCFTAHSRRSLACPHLCAGRIIGDLCPICPVVL